MNEVEAAVSTANATWALVIATSVLAVLTLAVVIVAVRVPQLQRHYDRREKVQRQAEVDHQAEKTINKTCELVREVSAELERETSYDQFALWALANRIQTQRRVVEYFFVPGSVSATFPYRLSACLQALFETADGVQQAIDKDGPQDGRYRAAVRAKGAATTKRALERLTEGLKTPN